MRESDHADAPVRTRAVLVEPGSLGVVWLNEAAARTLPEGVTAALPGVAVERVVPMAESIGLADAIRDVAATGQARHLQTSLVSMSRGGVVLVTSVYRLPDGMVLVLTDEAWQHRTADDGTPRRSRRGVR